jgi:hypothetical protein
MFETVAKRFGRVDVVNAAVCPTSREGPHATTVERTLAINSGGSALPSMIALAAAGPGDCEHTGVAAFLGSRRCARTASAKAQRNAHRFAGPRVARQGIAIFRSRA